MKITLIFVSNIFESFEKLLKRKRKGGGRMRIAKVKEMKTKIFRNKITMPL